MSKKLDAIKNAVFYSKENPSILANILVGLVSDTVSSIVIGGDTLIEIPTESSVTKDYTLTALSQFGDVMSGQSITLAVDGSVTGVSVSGKTLTVDTTAQEGTFKLKATCGSIVEYLTVTLQTKSE